MDEDFYSPDGMDTTGSTPEWDWTEGTGQGYVPQQSVDDFLGNQSGWQIDGNYFGQDQNWGNQDWGLTNQQTSFGGMPSIQQSAVTQQIPSSTNDTLARLFSNPNTFVKGLGALLTGDQNGRKSKLYGDISRNPALDPFGSQRPFYQQQLQQAVTNPYDSPIVRAQVDNMQRMQAIKDAAAGRRSNSLSTAPGVLAAQADIAQKYMNSLQKPAGADIAPAGQTIASLLKDAANARTEGYTSPIMNALGNIFANDRMDTGKQQAAEALAKYLNGG